MSTTSVVSGTPHYVLMDGNRRLGPKVKRLLAGMECWPIYGFSDKVLYDRFCAQSDLELKPYPLVKGYLRKQARASGGGVNLVVLDADGPREAKLHAAAMETVLDALEQQSAQVTADYRLVFDEETNSYRLDEDLLPFGTLTDQD